MAPAKRGPNTPSGKEKSSKNAVTHGLRSTQPVSTEEINDHDSFLKELVEFYKPKGPIEQLQLERIATCKAKLNSLYELERAKQALLIDQHRADTDKYIKESFGSSPLVRGMMKELFLLEKIGYPYPNFIFLPCQLNIKLLSEIVDEIDAFHGELISDADLKKYFPNLSTYLEGVDSDESALHVRLVAIAEQLEKIISDDGYHEAVKLIFRDKLKRVKLGPTPEDLEFDRQLEKHQEQTYKRLNLKPKVIVKDPPKQFPNQEKLTLVFKSFKTIYAAYITTQESAQSIRKKIDLHQRALSLPSEEADLLMRYQTSWERRLSTLIGELMQLQRLRALNDSK